jgi:hypothetical protein
VAAPTTAPQPLHPRGLIRKWAVTVLKGATEAGERVYANRAKPIAEATQLPVLLVYTPRETTLEVVGTSPRRLRRELRLAVEAIFPAEGEYEDYLADVITAQVEDALYLDTTIGGVAEDLDVADVVQQLGEESGRVLTAIRTEFAVRYVTDQTPSGELPDLSSLSAVWDIKPPIDSGESEPEDIVDLT